MTHKDTGHRNLSSPNFLSSLFVPHPGKNQYQKPQHRTAKERDPVYHKSHSRAGVLGEHKAVLQPRGKRDTNSGENLQFFHWEQTRAWTSAQRTRQQVLSFAGTEAECSCPAVRHRERIVHILHTNVQSVSPDSADKTNLSKPDREESSGFAIPSAQVSHRWTHFPAGTRKSQLKDNNKKNFFN